MVTVIIVNHNYGQFVGEAIESVLNQTYKDFELIVVDGASEDNSREVIMSYVNRYPDIINAVFRTSSGQAAAFNVGYKLAKGDIIAFLDADDYFYENKLEEIVKAHEKYNFVGHGRKILNAGGKLITVKAILDDFESRPALLKKYGYVYTYHLITSCISAKKSLLEKILPMPEENYITFADCYVKVMAQYYDNIKYLDMPLSFYRIHNMQKTNSFENSSRLNTFISNTYERIFRDINVVLAERKEPLIPKMTNELFKEGFSIANPQIKISEGGRYAVYGTGADYFRVKQCINMSDANIVLAIDSDKNKWGKIHDGVEIISPDDIFCRRNEYEKIIIGSSYYYQEIKEKLISMGLEWGQDFIAIQSCPND